MELNEHELYVDWSEINSIQCRKCNSKWRIKSKIVWMVAIPLILIGLGIIMYGVSCKSVWFVVIGLVFLSEAKWPWNIVVLILRVCKMDLERVRGEQYVFDFHTDREQKRFGE